LEYKRPEVIVSGAVGETPDYFSGGRPTVTLLQAVGLAGNWSRKAWLTFQIWFLTTRRVLPDNADYDRLTSNLRKTCGRYLRRGDKNLAPLGPLTTRAKRVIC